MPPKLLDIDTGGLQQYLVPGFAASIAKREEPNIEADAEGGMPIDVVGMYGYFDGDESAIMAPETAPILDPEDEALMLTPEQLKAGGIKDTSNFLRKTQYMTSSTAPQQDTRAQPVRQRRETKPKVAPLAREDRENIKRNIRKAFDLAYPKSAKAKEGSLPISTSERNAWDNPVHPERKGVKAVEFFPVLPDLDATTFSGQTWNLLRFDKPPLPAVRGHRDNRLDAAFLMTSVNPEKQAEYDEAKQAYEAEPTKYQDPGVAPAIWSLWLPRDQGTTPMMRKILDNRNPDHADEGILARIQDDEHAGKVAFDRSRIYTNAKTLERNKELPTRQVVLALDSSTQEAHYYPIGHVNSLNADRARVGQNRNTAAEIEETLPDSILVNVGDLNPSQLAAYYGEREKFDPSYEETYAEIFAAYEKYEADKAQGETVEDVPVDEGEAGNVNDDVDMTDD